jgi:hypothetical protein
VNLSRWGLGLLLLFVVADLGYSFWQHSHIALDGDLAPVVVPTPSHQAVLDDPLGLSVLTEGKTYPGPNRYVIHASLRSWFLQVPSLLQAWLAPIASVYLSSGLAKTLIQLALLLLLAAFVSQKGVRSTDFWLAAALLTPFFQTRGYNGSMGLIDISITYTFFYALPAVFFLAFLLPFFRVKMREKKEKLSLPTLLGLALLAMVLAFSGPLVAPAALLMLGLWGGKWAWEKVIKKKESPLSTSEMILLAWLGLLCLYSFWLGTHNSENSLETLSLAESYTRLPRGLFQLLTQKLGFPLLIAWLLLNLFLLNRHADTPQKQRMLRLFAWLGVFAVLYLLLLPLGGYREYRPLIIRRDTFLPVTLCLIYAVGASSLFLLQHARFRPAWPYRLGLLGLLLVFTLADAPDPDHNACEKRALQQLAAAQEELVELPEDCAVVGWRPVRDPELSRLNGKLFYLWGITAQPKRYVQP